MSYSVLFFFFSLPFSSLSLSPSGNHKQRFYWGRKEVLIPGTVHI